MGYYRTPVFGAIAAIASSALLLLGSSSAALAFVCDSEDGPWSITHATPDNTCTGTNPKECAFVSSITGDVYARVDGAVLDADAYARQNTDISPPGSVGSSPSVTITSSSSISFITHADWYGNIVAEAWAGTAKFWQGGYIWKNGSPHSQYGQPVAEGPGLKSETDFEFTGQIVNPSGSNTYNVGSMFYADASTGVFPGENEVDFYSTSYYVETTLLEIESIGSGSPTC